MPVPTYDRIDDSEIDAESPITESLMTRLRDNLLALFFIDTADTNPIAPVGIRGRQVFTSSGGMAVPSGVGTIRYSIAAAGGGGAATSNGGDGGDTVLSGSTTGAIATADGGKGGETGSVDGSGGSSGSGGLGYPGQSGSGVMLGNGGGLAGWGRQGSYGRGGRQGTGGGNGGGGEIREGIVNVTPGETLTITIGAGGSASAGSPTASTAGADGLCIIEW